MPKATVQNMRVAPVNSAHLSFECDGIVELSNLQVGMNVTPFDFATFYAGLLDTTGLVQALVYTSAAIYSDAAVQASLLAALRAEPRKAVLDKAICARQNAVFAKYANSAQIISLMNQYYSQTSTGSKPVLLAELVALAQLQEDLLNTAYTTDGRVGVVKTTTSNFISNTVSSGTAIDTGFSAGADSGNSTDTDMDGGQLESMDMGFTDDTQTEASSGTSASQGTAVQFEQIFNTDYAYRVPWIESQAQGARAQISLIDQQFAQFMYGQNLPYLIEVFANELAGINLDVKRLQVAYLDTLLMSPIQGTVTAIFKKPGDHVSAGEPVARVEDASQVMLIATLVCRKPISVGMTAKVTTSLFGVPGSPAIVGTVVAARGSRLGEDRWEVMIKKTTPNTDSSGHVILPLNYHFDYDDTTVALS
jgi:biotin carboxyl carrier protein